MYNFLEFLNKNVSHNYSFALYIILNQILNDQFIKAFYANAEKETLEIVFRDDK